MSTALYNENEPFAAAWLRNLSEQGHIANGLIDERSIRDVRASDLTGYRQAHFFAGIGVWSHALRLAGWPDDVGVWTGSCPCQPFSAAGKRGGFDDERHLWPVWFELIRQCRPPVIFGEQVASPDGLRWFDAVSADLEGEGYAVGAADLCAAGVGAPHIRQRLYFVAYAESYRGIGGEFVSAGQEGKHFLDADRGREARDLADSLPAGRAERGAGTRDGSAAGSGGAGGMDDALFSRGGRNSDPDDRTEEAGECSGREAGSVRDRPGHPGAARGFWADAEWLPCLDGKARPVEPGTFPLAHGAPARVGRLRAYGNAISPQVAATFIQAFMEAA